MYIWFLYFLQIMENIMNIFKYNLEDRVYCKDDICVVIGRAQYIVRINPMYMLQKIEENIEFDIDMSKAFWADESEIINKLQNNE